MVITSRTRITIDVTPLQAGQGGQPAAPTQVAHVAIGPAEPAEAHAPAAYEPAPCHCLDDEDCTADHEHE
jgi:hypothetical protein